MRYIRRLWWPVIVVLLSGCASQNVEWDYDASQSLSGLKTYAWMDKTETMEQHGYAANSLTDERVHRAVDQILAEKGMTRLDHAEAVDVLVNYGITVKTRFEDRQITTSIGFGRNSWGMGFSNDHYIDEYEEGSLVIDFIDPKTKKVLWRGVSKSRVQDNMTPEERTQKINQAVTQILSGYPRPVKK